MKKILGVYFEVISTMLSKQRFSKRKPEQRKAQVADLGQPDPGLRRCDRPARAATGAHSVLGRSALPHLQLLQQKAKPPLKSANELKRRPVRRVVEDARGWQMKAKSLN